MAKSSRSKWKKLHRRQRAQDERQNTVDRLRKLNKKLHLTAHGGISAVPPQEPETRFHFLNPELDPRVPNTSKNLNNNYRAELNHNAVNFNKPLKLSKPSSNFYGKSDPDAPHPQTVQFDTIDADAPLAGHALTKADMERIARKAMESANNNNEEETHAAARSGLQQAGNEEDEDEEEEVVNYTMDDGPEEYVFAMEDTAPRAVKKGAAAKLKSMETQTKKGGEVVSTAGSSKVKKMTSSTVKSSRLVSSGSKAAKKKVVMKK